MIRVAIPIPTSSESWLGGFNYLRSLVTAVECVPERNFEIVLFASDRAPANELKEFGQAQVVRTSLLRRWSVAWTLRKGFQRLLGRDLLLDLLFQKHRIKIQSHGALLGKNARVASVAWIPDFQHLALPEFFEPREKAARDRFYRALCDTCTRLILSSRDAFDTLAQFAPGAVPKAHVLNFVPDLIGTSSANEAEIREKYCLNEPFFHLPNQFWAHKNHEVVIRALAWFNENGLPAPRVVATGNTSDHRNAGHFSRLQCIIDSLKVRDRFSLLGVVPYPDLVGLMECSVAVINPSFFEGWSTTVEESKSLGKLVVLSDIPVHREQNPARAKYFDPKAPASLARQLQLASAENQPALEAEFRKTAHSDWPRRRRAFGESYLEILRGLA
jgi:hypothetical protein